jgi:hypothetical protein
MLDASIDCEQLLTAVKRIVGSAALVATPEVTASSYWPYPCYWWAFTCYNQCKPLCTKYRGSKCIQKTSNCNCVCWP